MPPGEPNSFASPDHFRMVRKFNSAHPMCISFFSELTYTCNMVRSGAPSGAWTQTTVRTHVATVDASALVYRRTIDRLTDVHSAEDTRRHFRLPGSAMLVFWHLACRTRQPQSHKTVTLPVLQRTNKRTDVRFFASCKKTNSSSFFFLPLEKGLWPVQRMGGNNLSRHASPPPPTSALFPTAK